jgi:hypothetical protein
MILLAVLLALILLVVLSIRYGADSRHLAGHDWW